MPANSLITLYSRLRTRVLRWFRSVWKIPALERALVRRTNRHPYSGLVSKLPPLARDYRRGTRRVAVRYGLRLDLDLSDLGNWYAYWGFTAPSHDALVRLCRPGATVVDVGANFGITAL